MNANPKIKKINADSIKLDLPLNRDKMSKEELFELIRTIRDPEHPFSLEELDVLNNNSIIFEKKTDLSCYFTPNIIRIKFKPTIPHCSMAATIGLAILYKIEKYITLSSTHISVEVEENTHVNWKIINKQLSDKDRVRAAFENEHIVSILTSII